MTSSVFTPGTKVRAIDGPMPKGSLGEVIRCGDGHTCSSAFVHVRPDSDPSDNVLMYPSELEPLS